MPTFFDVIEYYDIDINDERANFYLISLPHDGGFKFCATTQNLTDPLFRFDPETNIKKYWPITREQVVRANQNTLFPEDTTTADRRRTIRSAPFKTIADLNDAFNFNPKFDPSAPQRSFGVAQQAVQLMPPQLPPVIPPIIMPPQLPPVIPPIMQAAPLPFDFPAGVDILKQRAITGSPACIQAIQAGSIPLESLVAIDDISKLRAITGSPACIQAIADASTSIERLVELDILDLRHAVRDNVYPNHNHGLN